MCHAFAIEHWTNSVKIGLLSIHILLCSKELFPEIKGFLDELCIFLADKVWNNSSVTNLSIDQKGWLHSARRSDNTKSACWNTQKWNEKSYEMKSSVESLQLKTSISSICKCDTLEYLTLRTDENPNLLTTNQPTRAHSISLLEV